MAKQGQETTAQPVPLELVLETILALPAPALSRLVEQAVNRLDSMDLDPDLEEDDPSGQCDEDGVNCGSGIFTIHGGAWDGPGCLLGDGGE